MNTTKASQCVTSQCNVTDVVNCGADYSYRYVIKALQSFDMRDGFYASTPSPQAGLPLFSYAEQGESEQKTHKHDRYFHSPTQAAEELAGWNSLFAMADHFFEIKNRV